MAPPAWGVQRGPGGRRSDLGFGISEARRAGSGGDLRFGGWRFWDLEIDDLRRGGSGEKREGRDVASSGCSRVWRWCGETGVGSVWWCGPVGEANDLN
jgi:hypothetical protein